MKQIWTRIYSQMDEDIQRYAVSAFLMDVWQILDYWSTTVFGTVESSPYKMYRTLLHICSIPSVHQDLDSRSHLIECKRTKEIYVGALKPFMQLIQSTPQIVKEVQLLAPQIFEAHKRSFFETIQKTFSTIAGRYLYFSSRYRSGGWCIMWQCSRNTGIGTRWQTNYFKRSPSLQQINWSRCHWILSTQAKLHQSVLYQQCST